MSVDQSIEVTTFKPSIESTEQQIFQLHHDVVKNSHKINTKAHKKRVSKTENNDRIKNPEIHNKSVQKKTIMTIDAQSVSKT